MLADRFNTLQLGVVSTARILKLLDNNEQTSDEGTFIPEKINGRVEFKNIWFAYNDEDYVYVYQTDILSNGNHRDIREKIVCNKGAR